MKLSIVIPVYNVEKYIRRCLMSCIHQDIPLGKDYEIICVNDGSCDSSADIVRAMASCCDGITVIEQKNGGLSVARNAGLHAAKGDYLWFVDSDDWIEENCLKGILDKLYTTKVDVLCVQYNFVFEDDTLPQKQKLINIDSQMPGVDVFCQGDYPTMAQLSICKRKLFLDNNLEFYPGIFHEDAEITPKILFYASKVASYNEFVYNYLQRNSGSITSNYKLKNGLDSIKVVDSLIHFSQNFEPNLKRFFANRICQIVITHISKSKNLEKNERKILLNEISKKKYIAKYIIHSKSLKYRLIGFMLLCSIFKLSKLMDLKNAWRF